MSDLPSYVDAYAALLWREHAPAIREAYRTGSAGLQQWLEPVAQAFALTAAETGALQVVLEGRLRDEAIPHDAPPKSREYLLFR